MDIKELLGKAKDLIGKIDFDKIMDVIKKILPYIKKIPTYFASLILLLTVIFDPTAGSTDTAKLVTEKPFVLIDAAYMAQGITNDGTNYYMSGTITAVKFTGLAKYNMETLEEIKTAKDVLPDTLKKRGNDHIGGISYYDGRIYASVEDSGSFRYPCVAVFDANTLKYITHYDLDAKLFPKGIPWLAVNPNSGFLYTSSWSNSKVIEKYRFVGSQKTEIEHLETISLTGLGVIDRIQGGEFYNGTLYLSNDIKNNGMIKNILSVNVYSGEVKLAFTRDVGKEECEAEGLTICPTKDGSLIHVLDYNKLVGVYIRNYTVDIK